MYHLFISLTCYELVLTWAAIVLSHLLEILIKGLVGLAFTPSVQGCLSVIQLSKHISLTKPGTPAQEVVELYFQDSAAKLDKLAARLAESPPDYADVDALVHQFKGSSASFGAQTVAQLCVQVCDQTASRQAGR